MEFKGTKGEWVAEFGYHRETTIKCGEIRIAEVKHYNDGSDNWSRNDPFKEEGQANAKLIACAPKMLEMLKSILTLQKEYFSNMSGNNSKLAGKSKQIRDLIKKATE